MLIKGNITGSVSTIALNIPCTVKTFWLTNRSGSGAVVNVYIVTDNEEIAAVPVNMAMISGAIHVAENVPFDMKAGWYFIVVSNQSLDYAFYVN